jgi:bifunctional ADP-heptose synthase (sugar kinase/adenylyltransferase)
MYEKLVIIGKFDPFHIGHKRLIDYAKTISKKQIIYFTGEQKKKIIIENLSQIETIFTKNDQIIKSLEKNNIKNILLGSKDYFNKNTIKKFNALNINLIFYSGNMDNSPLHSIKNNQMVNYPKPIIKKCFNESHDKKILLIGDAIFDEYIYCQVEGLSNEEPMTVFREKNSQIYNGGTIAIAENLSRFVKSVDFITAFDQLNLKLPPNINIINIDEQRPITIKKRYKMNNQTVFKTTSGFNHYISAVQENNAIKHIKKNASQYDLIILSNFNFGLLTKSFIKKIIKIFKDKKPILSDSQISSQTGNLLDHKYSNYFFATEKELKTLIHDSPISIPDLFIKSKKKLLCDNLFLKLGENGVFTKIKSHDYIQPSLNHSPVNISGAGDAFIIGSALGILSHESIENILLLGQIFSAIQIGKFDSHTISKKDFGEK